LFKVELQVDACAPLLLDPDFVGFAHAARPRITCFDLT
jgi:hypothetical protein